MEVRQIDDVRELTEAARLLARVWGSDRGDLMPVNLMKALAHSGNYVAGAWAGRDLLGASVAWVWGPDRPRSLHSHITGVDSSSQDRGVGIALKEHQASWAHARGLSTVTWTFDPMVRRNAWFNLSKLGAVAVSYHPDFYGEMPDGVNAGELTDRCMVEWDVSAGWATAVAGAGAGGTGGTGIAGGTGVAGVAGGTRVAGVAGGTGVAGRPSNTTVLLCEGPDHEPEVVAGADGAAGTLLCQVPADGLALRRERPDLGRAWRLALRRTMGEAMASGYVATGMTSDGFYVLERRSR